MINQQTNQVKQYNMRQAQAPVIRQPTQQTSPKQPPRDNLRSQASSSRQGSGGMTQAASASSGGSSQQPKLVKRVSEATLGPHESEFLHFRIVRNFEVDGKTVFEMQVVPGVDRGRHWTVSHRFNDFRNLHDQLESTLNSGASNTLDQTSFSSASDRKSKTGTSQQSQQKVNEMEDNGPFRLPKFQTKIKSFFHGHFSIEKRTKFLHEYMNAIIDLNESPQLHHLLNCPLFTDFIDLISHPEIKRKLLNKLSEQQAELSNQLRSRLQVSKSQSSSALGQQDEESKKSGKFESGRSSAQEAPPKDSNERVERLLTKLENASKMSDMEELTRELRYLQEFDLMTCHYSEDQIKRTFKGNGVNQKGLLHWVANPRMASTTLKLLGRILDPQKNSGYQSFERVIQKLPSPQLIQCNLAQFFNNPVEEGIVIMLVDCYSRRAQKATSKKPAAAGEQAKPPNLFTSQTDYKYFLEIYQRWKDKRGRKQHIIQQERKSKLAIRQNDSFSSFSSAKSGSRLVKHGSGFFPTRMSSGNILSQNEGGLDSPIGAERRQVKKQGSHFGLDQEELMSDSSSESSECTFSDDVDKITIDETENDSVAPQILVDTDGDHSGLEETKSDNVSGTNKRSRGSKSKNNIIPVKKPSKVLNLEAIVCTEENDTAFDFEGRNRSKSSNPELSFGRLGDNSAKKESRGGESDKASTARKLTEDYNELSPQKKSNDSLLDHLQPQNINITSSSQHSAQSISQQILRGPDDMNQQILSWIMDYRSRECQAFDDLLYQSPKFSLGKLAAVTMRRKKNQSFLSLGQQSTVDQSFSLKNLVHYFNENLAKRDSSFIKGIKVRDVQQLSESHRIVEVETPSDFTRTSLSQENLSRDESGYTPFLKPKAAEEPAKKKAARISKHRFMLSFMTSEREAFVSLFLVNDRASQVCSDICIIMVQPLQHLGTVQEQVEEGEMTPPSRSRLNADTPSFETRVHRAQGDVDSSVSGKEHSFGQIRSAKEVYYEELKQSNSGDGTQKSRKSNKLLCGGFQTLAASESQPEIINPRKNSTASYSSSSAGTPSKGSKPQHMKHYMHALAAGASLNNGSLPACTGDITVLVSVKHSKTFLKLVTKLIERVVMEHHLY